MNCIEFRHICITTPDTNDADYLAHQQECNSCTMLAREMGEFDCYMHEAVNVTPPSGLTARILLRQSLAKNKYSRPNFYFSSALAACLLLVISMVFMTFYEQEPALEQTVIAYVNNNLPSPITEQYVQNDELENLFTSIDMKLNGYLGTVNYAKPCYIRNQVGLHLILSGSKGPVTVLIMPESTVSGTIKVNNTNLNGIIVPCPKGSMAILGTSGEALDQVEKRFRNSITWIGA